MKEQNRFAVGLEFLIVVVGILIAFQITTWSEVRQDNLTYELTRTRVIEEANDNLTLAQRFIARANDYKRAAREIIRDFDNCTADAGAVDRLMRAIQPLKFILGFDVRSDAIDLILTSDAFLDNISPQDRNTLSVYARTIDPAAENQRFSSDFQIGRSVLRDNPVFKRTLDLVWHDGLMRLELNTSYAEACKDSALNALLYDRVEHATYHLRQAESLANASREVLVKLGESPPELPDVSADPIPLD